MCSNLSQHYTDEERQSIIDEILERTAKEVSIESVISSYLTEKSGKNYKCPFHSETTVGAFSIHKAKNFFKCFSCETAGNPINFVEKYCGLGYFEAGIKLALDSGIMTLSEHSDLFGKKEPPKSTINNKEQFELTQFNNELEEKELKRLQSKDVIHRVYSKFISLCGLDNNHEKHLLNERQLTHDEIINGKFFTIQSPKEIIDDLVKYVNDNNLSLNGVPGFYQRKYYSKWVWNYTFFPKKDKPIAIPVFDEEKNITGIQYRIEEKTKDGVEKKYVWFSSTKYLYEEEKSRYGMGVQIPIGHIQSDNPQHSVFITEGTFKGLCLSKHTRMSGLILSGVGLQKNVVQELRTCIDRVQEKGQKVKTIFIAFDSDFKRNFSVYCHLKSLYLTLEKEFNNIDIIIMDWEESNGKGIDDLIINNKIKSVKRVNPNELIEIVNNHIYMLPNQQNLKANKSEDVFDMFTEVFRNIRDI